MTGHSLSIASLSLFIRELEDASDTEFDAAAFLDLKILEIENRIARSLRFVDTLKATRNALEGKPRRDPGCIESATRSDVSLSVDVVTVSRAEKDRDAEEWFPSDRRPGVHE